MEFLSIVLVILFATELEARVFQILEGPHFHDLLQDLPVGLRSHSVVAFYNKSCEHELNKMHFESDGFPGVHNLLFGRFELSTLNDRIWYEKEPHIDLANVLGAYDHMQSCPTLAFVPVSYADQIGFWYKTFPDNSQITFWDGKGDWRKWLWGQLKESVSVYHAKPLLTQIKVTHSPSNSFASEKTKTYTLDGFESHTNLEVFPDDTIEIISPVAVNVGNNGEASGDFLTNVRAYPGMKKLEIVTEMSTRATQFDGEPHKARFEHLKESWANQRHGTTMMTHVRNLMLPLRVPYHDKIGFKKIKMPEEINMRLRQYYRDHWHEQRLEEWDSVGTQLNFFDVKTHMVSLDNDWQERDRIAELIRPILEEWSGGQNLEMTAFYGIREYSRGASLRNHVDRVDTHIFSAICQIAQTGIDSPWPLEVYGFDGKNYEITLEPGEMILYEGAALIHGRPRPFNGTSFANAFVHFRPVGWEFNSNKLWAMTTKPSMEELGLSWNSIYS